MKQIYLFFIALLTYSLGFGQTEIFNESGGGSAPTGWTFDNNVASNDIDRTSYWLVEDGTPNDFITTATFDLSIYASAEFTLDVATFGSGTDNPAKIEFSFDGGSNYTQTEISNTPSSSTYIDGGTFSLNSVTSQVVIRITTNGTTGRDVRLQNLILTASGTSGGGGSNLNLSPTTLTGLDYVENSGPSVAQSFDVSGSSLDGTDVTVTAPTDFEVSTTEMGTYASSQTLTAFDGTATTLWVRLAAGKLENTYSVDVTVSGGGDPTDALLAVSGEVTPPSCVGSTTTFPFNGVGGSTNLDHSTSNPPGSSGESCGTNYLIYYNTTPPTDSGGNYFRSNSVDGLIESADWGGEANFETFAIDVSGETSVDIETFGSTTGSGFNAGSEEFQWWYTLDGGSQINLGSAFTGIGSLAVGPTNIDVTGVNNLIVGFTFNMNGGSDGFEDVDVTVKAGNDKDSEVLQSSPQVAASTRIASDFTSVSNTFPVLGFVVEDQGTSDGLPTNITTMRFVPGPNNTADWTDHIQGITLNDDNSNSYSPSSVSITDTEVILDFSTAISVPDGTSNSVEFELGIYLNTTNIVDGSIIQFQIDGTSSGFLADASGSSFSEPFSSGDIIGNNHTINVDATQLTFTQQPSNITVNNPITPSVKVAYEDVNGNIDVDFSGTGFDISLTTSGSFDATSTTTAEALNGIAEFSDLRFDVAGSGLILTAQDDSSSIAGTFDSTSFDVSTAPIFPTPGDLIITEVSDASDFNNEFIEIYNTTSNFIDMGTSKLVMQSDGTVYDFDDNDIPSAIVPSNGFLIVTRGGTQSNFETEFGTLNPNTAFVKGSSGMFFGTGTKRRWVLYEGGTTNTADGTLIDDTNTTVAGSNNRDFFNFQTDSFENTSDALANPSVIDNLVYETGAWKYNAKADVNTGESNVFFQDDFTATEAISMSDGEVYSVVVLDLNTYDLTINGTLTFKSDASGSAQLDDATGVTIFGDVTVERFIPAFDNINATNEGRAFRFLTSTVTTTTNINANWQEGVNNTGTNLPTDNQDPNSGYGIHISGSATGANGFDATLTGNPSMFTFNNASTGTGSQEWASIPGTDGSNILKAGRAYRALVRGDRSINLSSNAATPTNTTLRSTGELLTGQVVYATDVDALATDGEDYSFVANPYQAVVDYDLVTKSGLTGFIYVWDASSNSRGVYKTVNLGDQTLNSPFTANGSNLLAPGQAFFVQNDISSAGSITFEESNKVTGQNQVSVFNTNTDFKILSSLFRTTNFQNNAGVSDGLALAFSNTYKTLADIEDAVKFSNPDENYAVINNGLRSIDKQGMPSIGHQIGLFITNYRDTNYSLTFDISNKPDGLGVFLNDAYLNSQVELTNDVVYDFNIDENIPESIASDRFSLSFDNTTLGVEDNVFGSDFSVFPNPTQDGRFSIKTYGLIADEVTVNMHNMLGQQVLSERLTAENNGIIKVNASKLSAGVYILELSQDGQRFTQKVIVE